MIYFNDILAYFGLPLLDLGKCICQQLVADSRQVRKGDVFCAVSQGCRQRQQHIDQAIRNGAIAILYDQNELSISANVPHYAIPNLAERIPDLAAWFYGYPSQSLTVIGVTGTNGKTSICHYLAQILSQDHRTAVLGTVGNGIWPGLTESTLTTPDSCQLQQQLRNFADQQVKYVVMEASSHALAQQRVKNVQFDMAIFSNLTQDHLDYHGDMVAYAQAKQRLFQTPGLRYAVVNHDSDYIDIVAQDVLPSVIASHSCGNPAAKIEKTLIFSKQEQPYSDQIYLQNVQYLDRSMQLSISTPIGRIVQQVSLLGCFNIDNILAVVGALILLGYDAETIQGRLADLVSVRGRMQVLSEAAQPTVVIDYAHTPDAMRQALSALRQHCHGKLWVIFGCGGDRDRRKRPLMAQAAAQYADCIIVTEDNARFESRHVIIDDILHGFDCQDKVEVIEDRRQAIQYTLAKATETDMIALLGKGHETYLDRQGQKTPFNEATIVQTWWRQNHAHT